MHTPDVELLWWQGCPSTEPALAQLRDALRELGLDESAVRTREIRSDAEASSAGFPGSPTILVDGIDVVASHAPEPEPAGLTCRVYRRRDGKVSPTPDPEDVREALRSALARAAVTG